eukprot:TRINITY_DN1418_c0_g1_i1.p1 TRINITY_DN1418_c0_g1~~TRINITY_DN1418_c0_g1_i1.p1  ORF type:complete len:552 (-),score=221.83 TRINITY_DN1418_c0_g1_i1:58-1542(-)
MKTNEVSWEKPKGLLLLLPPLTPLTPPTPTKPAPKQKVSLPKGKTTKKTSSSVVYGPSPEGVPTTPEEIAVSRIRKFENDLADGIIGNIQKEVPLDWKAGKPSSVLYESAFKWNKLQPIFPSLEAKEKVKASKNAIALIGGVYGNEDSDSENEEEEERSPPKKRKISVKLPSSKAPPSLRPVPNAFLEESLQPKDNRPKSAGSIYKKSIDSIAETLCDKLEILKVASISITPLKLLAVQIETLFAAWQSGALSSSYLQRTLQDMNKTMSSIENGELSPPGWKIRWDSASKAYVYENLKSGEVRTEVPPKAPLEIEVLHIDSDGSEEEEDREKNRGIDDEEDKEAAEVDELLEEAEQQQPPLPPDPPTSKPPPPPPPLPLNNTEPQDMDLDEEEAALPPAPPPQNDLMDSALSSFYKDLASMETMESSASNSPASEESPSISPLPNENEEAPEELTEERRKRKTKMSSSLTLKKKGVSNLVAKWTNLQEKAKNTK